MRALRVLWPLGSAVSRLIELRTYLARLARGRACVKSAGMLSGAVVRVILASLAAAGAVGTASAGRSDVPRPRLPKALLINLPRHSERFETVKAQLSAAGVGFERIAATDGKALSRETINAESTRLGRLLMTKGMIGCYLSHRSCWEHCVAAGKPVIVFEDDVVLADDFAARLESALAELPEDWDVLLVGAIGAVLPRKYGANILHAVGAGGMRWPRWLSETVHAPLRPFGTHAYVISAAGANKLLTRAPRASYHVDVVAWGMRGLNLFAVHPLLAKQTHGDTTIGGFEDRSWIPKFTIDSYTGADFAWAWNAPLIQLGGSGGFLLTSGV